MSPPGLALHHFAPMLIGGRGGHWSTLVFLPLAAALVCPESFLEWFSDRGVKLFVRLSPFTLRIAALFGIIALTLLLVFTSAKFVWWLPLACVGFVLVYRAVRFAVKSVLGIGDDY